MASGDASARVDRVLAARETLKERIDAIRESRRARGIGHGLDQILKEAPGELATEVEIALFDAAHSEFLSAFSELSPTTALGLVMGNVRVLESATRIHMEMLADRIIALEKRLDGVGLTKYRGAYESGTEYDVGDFVTCDGSVWYCHAKTVDRPGSGSAKWQLAVKRGKDARPG